MIAAAPVYATAIEAFHGWRPARPGLARLPSSVMLHGMRTAVSIPDGVFEKAERLARRSRKSRSELYTHALTEYVARHAPEDVTEAMNRTLAQVGGGVDPFVSRAARRTLERTDW